MRLLAVTNMLPTAANIRAGTFIEQQIRSLVARGIEVRTLHLDRKGGGMSVYRHTISRVRRVAGECRPDVVHTMYGGLMGWMVSRAVPMLPIVQSFCGTDLQGAETGSLVLRARGRFGVLMSRLTLSRVREVVVKSRRLRDRLPAWFPPNRVTLIPNGVDLGSFCPLDRAKCRDALGWRHDAFHVVMATPSASDPNKRVWLAREALGVLRGRGVDAELHLMIEVRHDEVPTWLNAADAVVMTSVQEGSPNIVKEALACNRPVVAVDVGDAAEQIGGVEGCFLVDASALEVARGLDGVRGGPRVVAGREKVRQLSLECVADRLIDVYGKATNPEPLLG